MVGKISDQVAPTTPVVYFVYNANSGKLNAYLDMLHKIVSPKTYPCQLCDITYGVSKIRPEWDAFRSKSSLRMVFLHKDEWEEAFPNQEISLPAVLVGRNNEFQILLGSKDWQDLTLGDLINKLQTLEHELVENVH